MLFPIVPSYVQGGTVPAIRAADYPNGQTFLQGAPLISNGSGQYIEASAVPVTLIAGIAEAPYNGAPGFNMANQPTNVTYRRQAVSMAIANEATVFRSQLVNNSAVAIAPVTADNLAKYGLSKQAGVWVVDKSLTGASACLQIVEIDTTNNWVYFKFLTAAIATP
jgi:hypothetical protein